MFKFKRASLRDEMKVKDGMYFLSGMTFFKVYMKKDRVKLAYYEESNGKVYDLNKIYTPDFVQQAILKGNYNILEPGNPHFQIPKELMDYVIHDKDQT